LEDEAMTEPTNTDKARYVVERLGLCWHEYGWVSQQDNLNDQRFGRWLCKCGHATVYPDRQKRNPTFLDPAGRIQLLELMVRDYYDEFLVENGGLSKYGRHLDTVLVDLLIEPGLLLDAAYQFMKEKEI
jgi:hypothetical protein